VTAAATGRRETTCTPPKPLILALGLVIALPLAGHAAPICDMQGKCWADAPHQTYHMDPSNPDRETPPPAPQYPQGEVGRSITVQPSACHLFRMRSVPNIEPQIVEICPISPDEERAIRERADSNAAADMNPQVER
jgi:hypothetical protein